MIVKILHNKYDIIRYKENSLMQLELFTKYIIGNIESGSILSDGIIVGLIFIISATLICLLSIAHIFIRKTKTKNIIQLFTNILITIPLIIIYSAMAGVSKNIFTIQYENYNINIVYIVLCVIGLLCVRLLFIFIKLFK